MRYLLVIASMLTVLTVTAMAHPGHDDCPVQNSNCQKGDHP
jgi:hypothetical protein